MTENWEPDLQDLADEYGAGYVITAFKLQQKIKQQGYKGIHYSDTIESHFKRMGPPHVKGKVSKHMREELRKSTK